jgi:hypothetical protein
VKSKGGPGKAPSNSLAHSKSQRAALRPSSQSQRWPPLCFSHNSFPMWYLGRNYVRFNMYKLHTTKCSTRNTWPSCLRGVRGFGRGPTLVAKNATRMGTPY